MKVTIPRLMIAGTHSGVGKTTIMASLCRAFADMGIRVKPFKCGPDYVDPSFHRLACGEECINLDTWLMGSDGVLEAFAYNSQGYDLALIEGVMGYYDGASATNSVGSSADVARLLKCPTLLVCDASGMARSFSALVSGFVNFEGGESIECILANRVGSDSHANLLQSAVDSHKVLHVKKLDKELQFPDRHLGLVWAFERENEKREIFSRCSENVKQSLDLDHLIKLAKSAEPVEITQNSSKKPIASLKIGVIKDDAFKFTYQDQLQILEELGAEIIFLSALDDLTLPEDLSGLIIPGGYPELFASQLQSNQSFRLAIKERSEQGMPIYGECGGLMYLCRSLTDLQGVKHEMAGVFDRDVVMHDKLQDLGYVEVVQTRATILGPEGTRFRGHQFRYSSISEGSEKLAYSLIKKRRKTVISEGYIKSNTLGTYVHGHWASQPNIPKNFLKACNDYDRELQRIG